MAWLSKCIMRSTPVTGEIVSHTIASCPTILPDSGESFPLGDFFILEFLDRDVFQLLCLRVILSCIKKVDNLAALHVTDDDMVGHASQIPSDFHVQYVLVLAVCPRHDVFIECDGADANKDKRKTGVARRRKLCPEERMTISSLDPDRREKRIRAPKRTAIGNV